MGTSAAVTLAPASRPGDDGRGQGASVPSLGSVLGLLREISATAAADAALLGPGEAAEFAGQVEELSRAAEYLQIVAAGAVDRTRREAANDGSPMVDDGYRKTGEFLRDRLQISAGEAQRRLSLAGEVLPRTGITGQPLPPLREELAAAVAAGTVPSKSATIVTLALGRVRPLCDAETMARVEHELTRTAAEHDPDFLARVARRWMDGLDQDGAEPSEEVLRQLQGAFIRKPKHGLQHLEIFATAEQFEHLVTVMNTGTNPRTPAGAGDDAGGAGTGGRDGRRQAATDGFVPNQLDRRSRPQKQLDGLVGGCKVATRLRRAARNRRIPAPDHGHHRLPRPPRTPHPADRHRGRPPRTPAPGPLGSPAPEPWPSPAPSPPQPSAKSPATPTSSPSCSDPRAGSWTSAEPAGSSRPTSAKPSPPETRAAPSPTAPSPPPGAKPTTSPTGPAAAPHPPTTEHSSVHTITT